MKAVFAFWRHNNARIGSTLGALLIFAASRQLLSPALLDLLNVLMGIWVGGSWAQGARNRFKATK